MISHTYPVYLINLKHDNERRESSISQLYEVGIAPNVITAFNGHQKDFPWHKYRHLSRGKWWNKNVFKPGAFATYLSHVKCWQEIAKGTAEYAMILEDDMIINKDAFQKFDIEDNIDSFDIIFVNFGVTRMIKLTSFNEHIKENDLVSINELLINLLDNNKFNDDLTPGGYGYFVSKKGAIKLLQMMRREKICMGVDYAMIFNSLDDKSIEKIKKLKDIPNYLQNYIDNISDESFYSGNNRICLNSYVYTLPELVTHNDKGQSSLKHEIQTSFTVFNETNNDFLVKKKETLSKLFGFNVDDVDYLVNISNKYKYIYFETPKVGCSTIKKTLQKLEVNDLSIILEDVHNKVLSPLLSPFQLERCFTEYLTDEYFKFSFVRNPYTRILSCYIDKIVGTQKDVILPQLGFKSTDKVSFKEFLLAVRNQSYAEMNVHWKPQSVLLASENITLDFIGRQENFDNDLKKVLAKITKNDCYSTQILNEIPHAVGANKKLEKYLDEDTAKLIEEIYHDDFELYGYDKKEVDNLVSIVIPCYNQAQYLEETVESVVAQTYDNIEIIIVNDGSTDESAKVAQKLSEYYPDKNIRLVNQINKGLSEARNSGIREALGKYLFLLDADDKIHHNTLHYCMNAMVKENADIVYGDYQHFGEKSTIQKTRGKVDLYFIQYTNITGATALYKKSVWEKTGGYKQNMDGGYEDWELWVNAAKKGFKFHHISKVLFYYRVKKESMYTDAVKKHDYLCSKVVMNHPELYTESQQVEAIKSIQDFENAPDFFFYFDRDVFIDEKELMLQIEKHLKKNDLYEELQLEKTSIVTSLESFGKIALCSLHAIKDAEQLREVAMKSNADHTVLYSKLKHSTDTLDIGTVESSRFALSRQKGCVPAKGTLFPLLDTNGNLKTEAYKRSEQYFTERCQKLETRFQNNKYLDESNIDNIRDAAMVLEKANIELAYKLMAIAYEARPHGPRIRKKLFEFKSLLDINDDSVHKIEK